MGGKLAVHVASLLFAACTQEKQKPVATPDAPKQRAAARPAPVAPPPLLQKPPPAPAKARDGVALVTALRDAFNAGDPGRAAALVHARFENLRPPLQGSPFAGRAAAEELVRRTRRSLADARLEVRRVLDAGPFVAAQLVLRGSEPVAPGEEAAGRRDASAEMLAFLALQEGEIRGAITYLDPRSLRTQLAGQPGETLELPKEMEVHRADPGSKPPEIAARLLRAMARGDKAGVRAAVSRDVVVRDHVAGRTLKGLRAWLPALEIDGLYARDRQVQIEQAIAAGPFVALRYSMRARRKGHARAPREARVVERRGAILELDGQRVRKVELFGSQTDRLLPLAPVFGERDDGPALRHLEVMGWTHSGAYFVVRGRERRGARVALAYEARTAQAVRFRLTASREARDFRDWLRQNPLVPPAPRSRQGRLRAVVHAELDGRGPPPEVREAEGELFLHCENEEPACRGLRFEVEDGPRTSLSGAFLHAPTEEGWIRAARIRSYWSPGALRIAWVVEARLEDAPSRDVVLVRIGAGQARSVQLVADPSIDAAGLPEALLVLEEDGFAPVALERPPARSARTAVYYRRRAVRPDARRAAALLGGEAPQGLPGLRGSDLLIVLPAPPEPFVDGPDKNSYASESDASSAPPYPFPYPGGPDAAGAMPPVKPFQLRRLRPYGPMGPGPYGQLPPGAFNPPPGAYGIPPGAFGPMPPGAYGPMPPGAYGPMPPGAAGPMPPGAGETPPANGQPQPPAAPP